MPPGNVMRLDPAELTARFFRGLFDAYDLHSVRGVHVVVPKGTPVFAGTTLTEVAWQISEHARRMP